MSPWYWCCAFHVRAQGKTIAATILMDDSGSPRLGSGAQRGPAHNRVRRQTEWGRHLEARFILLPTRGFTASEPYSAPATLRFLASLTSAAHPDRPPHLVVLDSIRETGAKLVTLPVGEVGDLRRAHPGTRIVPEVFYQPARAPRPAVRIAAARSNATGARNVILTVVLQSDASTLADV